MITDPFGSRATLDTALGSRDIARIDALEGSADLPYSIKVLLESALRNLDEANITAEDVEQIASYDATAVGEQEVPFIPGRVILQDFTGVPAVVDLAAMRSAIVRMTGRPLGPGRRVCAS
jgi:aconitate hydratase